jgi:outer membrane protein TolC
MSFRKNNLRAGCVLVGFALVAGCKSSAPRSDFGSRTSANPARIASPNSAHPSGPVTTASYQEIAKWQSGDVASTDDPFADLTELPLDRLISEVQRRNPSIQAMVAAWQAAAQKYPQAISLDDPMIGAMLGPATFGSNDVDFGWMVDASQKVPWPGKRPLRGRVAQAEADAAFQDIEDTRLRLAEAAKLAFFDYFLVHREQEINADNVRIMQEFRNIAQTKYESNLVPQQDVLQAEVDLADLARRRVELERMNEVAIARINTLLHRVPDHPIPAPPKQIEMADGLPPAETLRKLALERRPDLAAQAARIHTEEAAVELACKEFYPDLEFVARYDAFWQPAERDLRPQVGMNLNLPIQRDRRRAAVAEAVAKVTQRRAELEQRIDEIQNEVQASIARLNEAKRVVALYNDSILPAAQKNIESAQAGYVSGRVDFLRLIEAQRQLINYREKQYEAVADYHRRLAELERVLAGPVWTNE